MINVDDRLLTSGINADQLYLLLHISKYINKDMSCFPSNATLCLSTAWGLTKLKEVKKSLIADGYISSTERKKGEFQLTNLYKIETEYLSVWVNLKGKGGEEKEVVNATGGRSQTRPGGVVNATTEVLTNKVLTNEGEKRGEKTPLPATAAENQFPCLDALSPLNKESSAAGPRHSDKPQNLETHTDLVKQIGEYYKANPREWIDSVKAMSGPMYSNEQLKGMLVDYCSHCFSSRNPHQKFSQHNGDFCRWVKNQKQFERTPAATPEKQADVTRFYNQIPVTK